MASWMADHALKIASQTFSPHAFYIDEPTAWHEVSGYVIAKAVPPLFVKPNLQPGQHPTWSGILIIVHNSTNERSIMNSINRDRWTPQDHQDEYEWHHDPIQEWLRDANGPSTLVYSHWLNMGMGTRLISLSSAIMLCKMLSFDKLIILDGETQHCPGIFSEILSLPNTIHCGHHKISVEYKSSIARRQEVFYDLQEKPNTYGICTFVHPSLVNRLVAERLEQDGLPGSLDAPPVRNIFAKDVTVRKRLVETVQQQIKEHIEDLKQGHAHQQVQVVGLYMRNGDMAPILTRNGFATTEDIAKTLHGIMSRCNEWAEANWKRGVKTLILASTDCGTCRKVMRQELSDRDPSSTRWKVEFFCTCKLYRTGAHLDAPAVRRCPSCDTDLVRPALDNDLRDSSIPEWMCDMLWIAEGTKFACPAWTSVSTFAKLLKGSRFQEAHRVTTHYAFPPS